MSAVACPVRARARRVFELSLVCEDSAYVVYPLPVDPAIGRAAWRFSKRTGEGAEYNVLESASGWSCECLGFLRWGSRSPCKHIRMVQAARRVFAGEVAHG